MLTWREVLEESALIPPKTFPQRIPLLDISEAILLPKGQLPVVLEKRHAVVIRQAMGTDRLVGVVQSQSGMFHDEDAPLAQAVGCLGYISALSEAAPGQDFVVLTGIARFRVLQCIEVESPLYDVEVTYEPFAFDRIEHQETVDNREGFLELVRGYCRLHNINPNWEEVLKATDDTLITSFAMMCPFSPRERQALLEMPTLKDREKMMTALMEMACLKDGQGAHLH